MSKGTQDLVYYRARAATELELAQGARHPKAAQAHHDLAVRYLGLAEQLGPAVGAEPGREEAD